MCVEWKPTVEAFIPLHSGNFGSVVLVSKQEKLEDGEEVKEVQYRR